MLTRVLLLLLSNVWGDIIRQIGYGGIIGIATMLASVVVVVGMVRALIDALSSSIVTAVPSSLDSEGHCWLAGSSIELVISLELCSISTLHERHHLLATIPVIAV